MKTKSKLEYSLIGLFLFFSINVFATQTSVSGTISSNTTWSDTINVVGNITINNGVKLTINPGTRINFNGHYHIYSHGAIQALGSSSNRILFTTTNTSTGWDGIQFDSPSTNSDSTIFNYCRFYHVKRDISGGKMRGGVISITGSNSYRKYRISNSFFKYNQVTGAGSWSSCIYTSIYTPPSEPIKIYYNTFKNNQGKKATFAAQSSICDIRGNYFAYNSNTDYGELYFNFATADIIGNYISNNTGKYGVGICLFFQSVKPAANIINNVIVNNNGKNGGGVYVVDAYPNIINNTICNNKISTTNGGAALYFRNGADGYLKNNIIYGNRSGSSSTPNQVWLNDLSADPDMHNNDIEGGKSAFKGPGSGSNYLGVYLNNIDVDPDFIAPSSGAGTGYSGISANWGINQGAPVINTGFKNSESLNLPTVDYPGNVRIFNGRIDMGAYENQDSIIAQCTISNNTIWDADTVFVKCNMTINSGATLEISAGTNVIMTGFFEINVQGRILAMGEPNDRITFRRNDTTDFYKTTQSSGAWHGIKFYNTPLTNDSSKFYYCRFLYGKKIIYNGEGGVMYIRNYSKVLIDACEFSSNSSSRTGGAIYLKTSNIVFRNNIVANNYAYKFGGGMWIDDCVLSLENNTIANNSTERTTYSKGGGIYIWSSEVEINNSIFWGNRNYNTEYGSQIGSQSSNLSRIYNSDIQYGISRVTFGTSMAVYQNNMDINPMFINSSSGAGTHYYDSSADWGLQPNTPMVDQGKANSIVSPTDFAGNPRLVSDSIDIGAYEVQLSPKFITQNPVSKSVCAGNASSYSTASTITVNYQWMHNGQAIPGATASSYLDGVASVNDTGYYYCIMSTPYGSLSTDTARFDIIYPPVITSSPISVSACVGDSSAFSVMATGSQPMSYNWENTYGQLASSPTIGVSTIGSQNLSNSSNGYPTTFASYFWGDRYQFIIRASELINEGVTAGNIQSIAFNVLNVNSCSALSNYSLKMGTTTNSSLTSTFISNLSTVYSTASFQPIQGWNTIQLQTPFNWDGSSNIIIEISSQNLSSVNAGNTTIAQSITSYTSSVDYHANNKEVYSHTTGTTYSNRPMVQFRMGNAPITSYYIIDSVLATNASVYKCNVSNVCGAVMSSGAQLIVNTVPSVVPIIAAASICEGASYTYSTSATGSTPITYQWYKDGTAISGSTSISHSISSASSTDDGIYYCKAINACGNDSTNQSVMSIKLKPTITSQPTASQTLCANQSASLSVTAMGYYPISYQWYKAGAPIGGAATPNYYMSPISVSDAGIYKCVATNTCGSDQSNNVSIAVNSPPSITYQSGDSSRCENGQMTFDLTAVGTAPLTYQWYKGTSQLSGANTNTYQLNNLSVANTGNYHCVITNSCASITSSPKHLTVNANPQVSLGNDTTFCLGGSTTIGPGYGYFCLWNNGSYNNQLTVTSTGSYFVNVTDQNGCSAVSDTISVTVNSPYANQEICVVTVDSATGKNAVVWPKVPNQSIASFNIYKESAVSGVYNIIANQPYDSLSVIIDNTSLPMVKPDRYVITVVDSCGNESSVSPAHRTMHLTVNKGQNNDWNLIWNAYEGFTPSSYKIYRADTSLNYVNIATVAGSSNYTYLYTDQTATANAGYFYYVEVVHPNGGCSVTKGKTSYNSSRSNNANNGMANPSSLVPSFFGTPTSGIFPLDVHFFDQSQGSPIEWEWDFGDGNIDSVQNPSHTYTQIGVYSVSLVVKDATSDNTIAFQNYITVLTTGISEVDNEFVVKVFPNPYSDKTNIAYALTNQEKVVIEVYTSHGQKVAELVNGLQAAGSYKYQFRAADYGFASGVYVLRMKVGDQLITKKLIEVK